MMLRSSDDMLTHVKTAKSQTDGLERILFNINNVPLSSIKNLNSNCNTTTSDDNTMVNINPTKWQGINLDGFQSDIESYSDNELPLSSIAKILFPVDSCNILNSKIKKFQFIDTQSKLSNNYYFKSKRSPKKKDKNSDNLKTTYECDLCGKIFYRRYLIIKHLKNCICFPESLFDFDDFSEYNCCTDSTNSELHNMNNANNCITNNTNKNDEFEIGQTVIQNEKLVKRLKISHSKNNNLKCDISFNINNTTHKKTSCVKEKYKWACKTCGQPFDKLSSLNTLKYINPENGLFYCDSCDESYISLSSLEKHRVNHIFNCHICHEPFFELSLLTAHKRIHKFNSVVQCHICLKNFMSKSSIAKHFSKIHDSYQIYECSRCSEVFYKRSKIVTHIFNYHQEDYSILSCDPCSELYESSGELVLHLEKSVFKCDVCPQSFITSYKLKEHYKWHLGINTFNCQYCPKRFSEFSVYFSHEQTHSEEKPFRCNFCGQWFPFSSNFNIHLRINSFVCNNNQKIKKTIRLKKNQLKTKYCDKFFSQSSAENIRQHILVETNTSEMFVKNHSFYYQI